MTFDDQTTVRLSQMLTDLTSLMALWQKLYERLSEDRQQWVSCGGDMASLVETFELEVTKCQQLQAGLKAQLSQSLQQESRRAVDQLMSTLREQIQTQAHQTISHITQPLAIAGQQASQQLTQVHRYYHRLWWGALVIMLAGFGSSLLGSWWLQERYDPQHYLSAYDQQCLREGQWLKQIRTIPLPERQRLLAIYFGDTTPSATKKNKK